MIPLHRRQLIRARDRMAHYFTRSKIRYEPCAYCSGIGVRVLKYEVEKCSNCAGSGRIVTERAA